MKISKALIFIFSAAVNAIAVGQTLLPPPHAGQSYWFGPGPATLSVVDTEQTDGGYAEHYFDLGTGWNTGVTGGPAYVNSSSGASASSTFNVNTTMQVFPYIYVDGYFAVSAAISGFLGGSLNLGSSKFYVLHNSNVQIAFNNLQDLSATVGVSTFEISTVYNVFLRNYANPVNYTNNFQIAGAPTNFNVLVVDDVDSQGVLEVEIVRLVDVVNNTPATFYNASGTVMVSSA